MQSARIKNKKQYTFVEFQMNVIQKIKIRENMVKREYRLCKICKIKMRVCLLLGLDIHNFAYRFR